METSSDLDMCDTMKEPRHVDYTICSQIWIVMAAVLTVSVITTSCVYKRIKQRGEILHEFRDLLTCSICHDTYTDPKVLQCNHVFCRDCLAGLALRHPQGLPCPLCREVTPIPPSGVAGLQSAFQINGFLELYCRYKKDKKSIFTFVQELQKPYGIALCQSGEIVVTELNGHCISVFNPGGRKLRSFSIQGSVKKKPLRPHGVAVDGEGNILVADCYNHRIQKFTAKGQFLTAVGTKGSGPLQFNCIKDIAISTVNDEVYVVDEENNRVQVLKSDLTFCRYIGKRGKERGELLRPCGIACDSTGNVYVADSWNNRIQVFTPKGRCLRIFGEDKMILNPVCIAIDVKDKVYISDNRNHCVSVLTSEGKFVSSFGGKGKKEGEFLHPRGVVVDRSGVVYVCDSGNCRIQLCYQTKFSLYFSLVKCYLPTRISRALS